MILIIKESPDLSTKTTEKLIALENILKAHGEAKHLLWMPHNTATELLACEKLGFYSKKVLTELKSEVNETREITNKFKLKLTIDFSDQYKFKFEDGSWMLGFGHFRDSEVLQKPILLTENDDDAKIFVIGAKTYLIRERIGNCDIKLETSLGGGDTTYKIFKKYKDEQIRFVACIIDSDKEHPRAPLGSTAKKFAKLKQGYCEKTYFQILDCHEIENILPINILKEVAGSTVNSGIIFNNPKFKSFRKYPDHKKGLTVAEAMSEDAGYRDKYWSDFKGFEDHDIICPNFGEKLLANCLRYLEENGARQASKHIQEETDNDWINIIKTVAEWGVSSKRVIS